MVVSRREGRNTAVRSPLGAKDPLSEDGFHGAKVAAFPGGLGILLPVRRGLSEARDRLSSAAVKTMTSSW